MSDRRNPQVTAFFDDVTNTVTYVVKDPTSNHAAILDSVLDFDPKSGRTHTESADRVITHVKDRGLEIGWLLETHAHADHLSAAPYLKDKLGGKIAIGAHIKDVQKVFSGIFNIKEMNADGRQFDHLFEEGDTFTIGALEGRAMHTPGHTPACLTYMIGDAAFVGDTLFMPDYGTARADFPGGDAATLYRSVQKLYTLPDDTRLFLCHDYMPGGRAPKWETTVGEERRENIHIHDGVTEAEFVDMRTKRDATLEMPTLILPSVQVNMRAGQLPPAEDNGVSYLKLPINLL